MVAPGGKGGKQEKGGKHEEKGKKDDHAHKKEDHAHKKGAAAHDDKHHGDHKHGHDHKAHAAAAAKWADETPESGEFTYAAGSSFVAPLIAHYAAASRTAHGGASSDWKDAHWPAASLLTVLKRATGAISLKVGAHTVTGDYEIARYLVRRPASPAPVRPH